MSSQRAIDPKHQDCPPIMQDGRAFTNYSPRCQANFNEAPAPMNSYDYRMFLIRNAEKLMWKNSQDAQMNNVCGTCSTPSTQLPEQSKQTCNEKSCSFAIAEPSGLGLGREYASF